MPLFTRRRLQAMLDEIGPLLADEKSRDLLNRLENKRVEQVLPAEVELALLWALAGIGEIDVEPSWWDGTQRPDAYTEALIPGEPAVIEIAAPNDNGLSGEEEMDGIARKVSAFADTIERGSGVYLRFFFGETYGYRGRSYFRQRLAPPDYELSEALKLKLRAWIIGGESRARPLEHVEPGLSVRVERANWKQIRFHNIHSSMPPEAYSIDKNPLFKLLERKLGQLRGARPGTHRFIFLGDVGSTLLNRMGQGGDIDPTNRRLSGAHIIGHFVLTHQRQVDSVVAISPRRERSPLGPEPRLWAVSVFNRPGFDFDLGPLHRLVGQLPRPRFEGYQARSMFRQGMFSPKARGWWVGVRIEHKKGQPMQVKVSARMLMDLLAERITPEQFRYHMSGGGRHKNSFRHWLDRGLTIQAAEFESLGLDADDDVLVLTLSDDPAARALEASAKRDDTGNTSTRNTST
jgi:hypothetical protein